MRTTGWRTLVQREARLRATFGPALSIDLAAPSFLLLAIHPNSNSVAATIDVGAYTTEPFVVADAPWFAVSGTQPVGGIVRINPASDRVDQSLALPPGFVGGGTTLADDSAWIVDVSGNQPIPSGPSTIARIPRSAFSAP